MLAVGLEMNLKDSPTPLNYLWRITVSTGLQ